VETLKEPAKLSISQKGGISLSNITLASNPSTTFSKEDTITNAISQWLYGKSNHSKRNYNRVIRNYISYLGDTHIANSTAANFRNYQNYLYECGKTVNTINTYTNIIKSFFSFLRDESVLPTNITSRVKSPKPVSALRERILTRAEIDAIITLETNIRNRLILQLLFFCGLRVSELTVLLWGDIKDNGSTAYIHITGKGNKQRTLIIPPLLWASLKKYKTTNESPVFKSRKKGKNLTQKAIWDIVHLASQRVGISASPHWLRHSHATLALQSGADINQVSTSLGHSSVATTSKYLHARPNDCSSLYL
jgi:integrase/recombinase XerD